MTKGFIFLPPFFRGGGIMLELHAKHGGTLSKTMGSKKLWAFLNQDTLLNMFQF